MLERICRVSGCVPLQIGSETVFLAILVLAMASVADSSVACGGLNLIGLGLGDEKDITVKVLILYEMASKSGPS